MTRRNAPATDQTAFAKWTREQTPGQVLHLANVAQSQIVRLDAVISKRADQIAGLYLGAPTDVRDAAVAEAEKEDAGLSDIVARAVISNERVDSYDSTLSVDGWETADFKRNPVVLFAHESYKLPVGRDLGTFTNGETRALMGVTRFVSDKLGAEEAKVGKWVAAGVLNATSVGFEPLEAVHAEDRDDGESWYVPMDFVRMALREYSWVPVPANPDCLVDSRAARAAGLDPRELRGMLEQALDSAGVFYVPRATLLQLRRSVEPSTITIDLGALGVFEVRDETLARADLECPACGHTGPADTFAPSDTDDGEQGEPADEEAGGEAGTVDETDEARHDDDAHELAEVVADVLEVIASGRLP